MGNSPHVRVLHGALSRLEPCAGKLACTVLRGRGGGNAALLPDRVLFLTMLGRECPEMPCDTVFADEEWKAVYLVTQRKPPPSEPPSLDTMVRMIAGLGGFLNRKSDGFPGPKTLWIGLQRVPDFVLALEAQRSIGESCG
jgi:hypothetical protein